MWTIQVFEPSEYIISIYSHLFVYILAGDINAILSRSIFSELNDAPNDILNPDSTTVGNDVVFVMLSFALDLLQKMKEFNEENIQTDDKKRSQGALRIGNILSHC